VKCILSIAASLLQSKFYTLENIKSILIPCFDIKSTHQGRNQCIGLIIGFIKIKKLEKKKNFFEFLFFWNLLEKSKRGLLHEVQLSEFIPEHFLQFR
jgi:hypothetical protein